MASESFYLLTNLAETQQVVELGEKGDIDKAYIIPAKSRIKVSMSVEKAAELKSAFNNIIAVRKL